ncbi:MAG: hypothetical protein ACTSX8_04835 [Alphaproteobacteria bacterium]
MGQLLKVSEAIAGNPQTGVVLILVILLGLAAWAYWQERKEVRKIQNERLKEAREDTKSMADALNAASVTVAEFKSSNDALRIAFEALTRRSVS